MPKTPDGRSAAEAGGREVFSVFELATVLSHYDLGVIQSIKSFPRGSRKAPKLVLNTDKGRVLLKRRAHGKNDAHKVAFGHQLQLFLAAQHFPLPTLIGTTKDNNSLLQWEGAIYEVFEFISGNNYDSSLEATADAGRVLGLFHKLLRDYEPHFKPAKGSYHASRAVDTAVETMPHTLAATTPSAAGQADDIVDLVAWMAQQYKRAAAAVNDAGLPDWPVQIVHGDWHPGNMLFRGPRVVAVIDYDAARMQQRVLDIANGALQFSILGGRDDPDRWPDHLDISRYKRFVLGYEADPACVLSRAELRAIPPLMIEALISECVIPIAATGSFAQLNGLSFLRMVQRKVRWLVEQAEALVDIVEA